MKNNKNEKFLLAISLAVITLMMLFLTIRMGFNIGGSIGQFVILLSATLIIVILISMTIAYFFLVKRK